MSKEVPKFRIVVPPKRSIRATGTTLEFDYVDRAGKSQRFYETIYGHKDELGPPEYQAALQLQKRLQEQQRALEELLDQFVSFRYPR